ncbi:MAG: hypothetical protein KGZ90_08840 [Algoriphagus sp.]|nr:hypothetical protein [Algoriphagus sp.]
MADLEYICPIPKKWHEIHQLLLNFWGKNSGIPGKKTTDTFDFGRLEFQRRLAKKGKMAQHIKLGEGNAL